MRKVILDMGSDEISVDQVSSECLYTFTTKDGVYILTRRAHISVHNAGEPTDQGPYFWLSLTQGTTRGNAWGTNGTDFRGALRQPLSNRHTVWAFDNHIEFGKWLTEQTLC